MNNKLSPNENMKSVIQRIATGPELSKNISREEAKQTMLDILNDEIDPVQAAIFLIALRMKRETIWIVVLVPSNSRYSTVASSQCVVHDATA